MARRDGSDSDRPKKSWREIDKAREKSGSGRSSRPAPGALGEERLQKTQAYQQYKNNLDKFFDGSGAAPDGLAGLLDPSGAKGERSKAVEEIQKASASDRRKWADLVKLFVEQHELPPDAYLLTEFLAHPKESVAAKALTRIAQLVEEGALKKLPASLKPQLQSLELTCDDDDLKIAAKALRTRLDG